MGTSRSVAEFSAKIDRTIAALRDSQREAVERGAEEAKRVIDASIKREVPSMRLRNAGRGGPVGVSVKVTGTGLKSEALVQAIGLTHWVEFGTRPHRIERRGKRSGRRALRIPGRGFYASVRHPGTRGRYPFLRGRREAAPRVVRAMRGVVVGAVKRVVGP